MFLTPGVYVVWATVHNCESCRHKDRQLFTPDSDKTTHFLQTWLKRLPGLMVIWRLLLVFMSCRNVNSDWLRLPHSGRTISIGVTHIFCLSICLPASPVSVGGSSASLLLESTCWPLRETDMPFLPCSLRTVSSSGVWLRFYSKHIIYLYTFSGHLEVKIHLTMNTHHIITINYINIMGTLFTSTVRSNI